MDVNEAMSKLEGLEPDDIASFLQDQGIEGYRINPLTCVIARYLQTTTGDETLGSTRGSAVRYTASTAEDVYTYPDNVSRFILAFDLGNYPNLVKKCYHDPMEE